MSAALKTSNAPAYVPKEYSGQARDFRRRVRASAGRDTVTEPEAEPALSRRVDPSARSSLG